MLYEFNGYEIIKKGIASKLNKWTKVRNGEKPEMTGGMSTYNDDGTVHYTIGIMTIKLDKFVYKIKHSQEEMENLAVELFSRIPKERHETLIKEIRLKEED